MATGKACRHCGQFKPKLRPRDLCWACYYAPGVRALYRSISKFGQRGVANFAGEAPPPVPTPAAPGSAEKVAVLVARAARGEALFHPEDERLPRGRAGRVRGFGVFRAVLLAPGQYPHQEDES